jgi:hypothetical protein
MHEKRWLAIIFSVFILFGLAYSVLLPPWEGPDESNHYLLALILARGRAFPGTDVNYMAHQPQLFYRIGAEFLKLLHSENEDWIVYYRPPPRMSNIRKPVPIFPWSAENYIFLPGLFTLRWFNLLLATGALALNYHAVRRLTGGNTTIALTALAFTALTPQFLSTSTTVSNDALGFLAGAFLVWLLSWFLTHPMKKAEIFLSILLAILLPFATKLTALPVGVALVLGILFGQERRLPGRRVWALAAGALAGFIVLVALVIILPDTATYFFRTLIWRAFIIDEGALSWAYLQAQVVQIVRSYWGFAGWLSVSLSGWTTAALTAIAGTGVLAALWDDLRSWREGKSERVAMGAVWLAAGLPLLAVLKNALNTVNSQGRFLFPAIGVFGYLVVKGGHRLIPSRGHGYILPATMAIMILANLELWITGLIPVYYQPFFH